jgi:hypothetical protein
LVAVDVYGNCLHPNYVLCCLLEILRGGRKWKWKWKWEREANAHQIYRSHHYNVFGKPKCRAGVDGVLFKYAGVNVRAGTDSRCGDAGKDRGRCILPVRP